MQQRILGKTFSFIESKYLDQMFDSRNQIALNVTFLLSKHLVCLTMLLFQHNFAYTLHGRQVDIVLFQGECPCLVVMGGTHVQEVASSNPING